MKISRLSLLAFLFLTVVGLNRSTVLACSCREFSACEAFNFSSAVFIGRPISASHQRELDAGRIELFGDVVFEVLESFSGVSGRTVTAESALNQLCGGHTFTPGTLYLIYASETKDKALVIGACSRTRRLDISSLHAELNANAESERERKYLLERIKEYEDELVFLRNAASQKINGGRVFGTITTRINYLEKLEDRGSKFMAGVAVKIEGEGHSATTQTNESGEFSFDGLQPGTYSVTVKPPKGYQPSRPDSDVKQESVLRNCGCSSNNFRLVPTTNIQGKVLDEEGKPIEGIRLEAISARWQSDSELNESFGSSDTRGTTSTKDGEFIFENLPAGRYLVGVSLVNPDPQFSFSKTFYPQTSDIKLAEVITVELGKKVRPLEFRLTKKEPTQIIEGVVLWPDETPVFGALVRMTQPGNYGQQWEVETDEKGSFTLKAVKGHSYNIEVFWAEGETESGKMKSSPFGWETATPAEQRITATEDIKGLKFVLTNQKQ